MIHEKRRLLNGTNYSIRSQFPVSSWLQAQHVQFGGKRPLGVSLLYIGWDTHYGFQLYQSDPSGNYGVGVGWKATCIGNNGAAAVSMLKQDYREGEMTLKPARALAVKVLNKTMDVSKLSAENVEIATLTRKNGKSDQSPLAQGSGTVDPKNTKRRKLKLSERRKKKNREKDVDRIMDFRSLARHQPT